VKKSIILTISIAVVLILAVAVPAFAIDNPTVLYINSVFAYQHTEELNDMAFLVGINTLYTVYPDETATESLLVIVVDGDGNQIASAAPYTYVDSGYGYNYVWIRIDADDSPQWNGSYTVWLVGNPTLDWSGAVPKVTASVSSWMSSNSTSETAAYVASRILYVADQLELIWELNLIEEVATGGSALTTTGASYFQNVIPNLRTIAPGAFSSGTIDPVYDVIDYERDVAEDLLDSTSGTPLDMSDLATALGISEVAVKTALWFLVSIVIVGACVKFGMGRLTIIMFDICLIGGTVLGMLDMVVIVTMGVICALLTPFILFYNKSSA
jgi:hypothetical protein